jgi:heme/copper-type cytochrome/quinol oxidase subunit 2
MVNPLAFSSELTKNNNLLSNYNNFFSNFSETLGLNSFYTLKFIFSNILNLEKNVNLDTNLDLFKNQYRPMKKGIVNMVRLHATSAIAMPIETRLHILTSSKDVIHSWAIPSAGIKMDCIPGYSSHRISIFLVSGIF